jgi:hypothetical protein
LAFLTLGKGRRTIWALRSPGELLAKLTSLLQALTVLVSPCHRSNMGVSAAAALVLTTTVGWAGSWLTETGVGYAAKPGGFLDVGVGSGSSNVPAPCPFLCFSPISTTRLQLFTHHGCNTFAFRCGLRLVGTYEIAAEILCFENTSSHPMSDSLWACIDTRLVLKAISRHRFQKAG